MLSYFKYLYQTWYWARINRTPVKPYGAWERYRQWTCPLQLIYGDGIVYEDFKTILEPARIARTRARMHYVVYSYALLF